MLVANAYPGLLEGLIPLGIGVYMTGVYFGVIPAGLDAKKAAKWRARAGGRGCVSAAHCSFSSGSS